MADTKISGLADGAPAEAADIVPVARAGATKRLSLTNVITLLGSSFAALAHHARHEDAGADEISVTGLSGLLADAQTPLTENVQDIVGAMATDTATIDFTYSDAAGTLIADVKAASITEAMQVLADNTTNNVTSTAHGYAPKSGGNAATFLNGAATPAYAAVTGANLSMADVTTNDVTSSAHGFAPKSSGSATVFLNGAATPAYAAVKESDLAFTDVATNNASTSAHGFLKKLSNTSTEFMNGVGNWATPGGGNDARVTLASLSSDATTNSTTTGVEITGINTTTGTGRFAFQYFIRYQSGATTTGVKFGINHTGTVTAFAANCRFSILNGAPTAADQTEPTPRPMSSTATRAFTTTAPDLGPTISIDTQDADSLMMIEGFLIVTVDGDLELWHASEVAAASTVKAGTALVLLKVS